MSSFSQDSFNDDYGIRHSALTISRVDEVCTNTFEARYLGLEDERFYENLELVAIKR